MVKLDSSNIFAEITKRKFESCNNILAFARKPKIESAEEFRSILFDYTCEKLLETDENHVILNDLRHIFQRLDRQFESTEEQEEFYRNYMFCVKDAYDEVTGLVHLIEERKDYTGELPFFENDRIVVGPTMSNETATIWIYDQFEKEIESSKQKVKK